jgi:phage FluMu protein Com
MQLRCYQCGWSFGISKEEIAAALEALQASGGTHYDAHCPRCKRANKVSLEQLKRSLPRPRPEGKKPA